MDHPTSREAEQTDWWDRLDRVVDQALLLTAADRDSYLRRVCGEDPRLHAEAASLLAHTDRGEEVVSSIAASLHWSGESLSLDDAAVDPLIGERVHQYTIEARLGSGGMGVVYRALDTRLGRPVALKFIWPDSSPGGAGMERMLREAQAAAALDHQNVCTIHEVGESPNGGLFIAMAYYEGETLKARLARGKLSIQEVVDAVRQAAEGVHAAHSRGIVHCDIKPGNILFTNDGVAKLLDFGVAKREKSDGRMRVGGTTAYMSPEQCRGEPFDTRSDIWSLGVVAFELFSSRRPFEGKTPAATKEAILSEMPPSLSCSRDDVPAALEEVVRRALSKDPGDRQQSAAEFGRDLERANLESTPGPQSPVEFRQPSTYPRLASRLSHRATVLLGIGVAIFSTGAILSRPFGTMGSGDPRTTTGVVAAGPAKAEQRGVSVAVLRFEDGDSARQTWVADGMTEAIQAEFRKMEGVRVVGHFSSLAVSGIPDEEALFGSDPGSHYLLTGAVERSGDSIWVTPMLQHAGSRAVVWTSTFGGGFTPEGMSEMAGLLAREAARSLALRFPSTPRQAAETTPDQATYERYLEGRYHLRRFQSGVAMRRTELDRSVAYLREVVARDSSWAPGVAALGEALSWIGMFEAEQGRLDAAFAEAKGVLEHALALDPSDARAHATLGYVVHRYDLDFDRSEALFRRALEMDPDQYWHCGYGFFLLWAGRYEEAAQAFRRSEVRDPLYLTLKDFLAASYVCSGRYDEAIATSEELLAQVPQMGSVRRSLVLALEASGRETEAFARIDEAAQPNHPYWTLLRALLHARSGREAEADALLLGIDEATITNEMRVDFPARQLSPAPLYAAALVALDRRQEALQMLEAAFEQDPGILLYDRCFPELELLEDDPRYRSLLERSGVPS